MKHIVAEYYWLEIPLKKPYRLSFGDIESYNSFIIIYKNKEKTCWGEVTALPGYSWEHPVDIDKYITKTLTLYQDVTTLYKRLRSEIDKNPFAVTPILTGLEQIFTPIVWPNPVRIPLIGILNEQDTKKIRKHIQVLLKTGYKVIKYKVGKNVEKDLQNIYFICKILPKNIKLRLDANQGYKIDEARYLVKHLKGLPIEFLEQPLKKDEWGNMSILNSESPVPLMLDESIWTKSDIEKVVQCKAASYIKLKLCKHGSPLNTVALAIEAFKKGLNIVLGNGVQTELGCYIEGQIYNKIGLKTMGEMNGVFKLKKPISNIICIIKNGKLSAYFKNGLFINEKNIFVKKHKTFNIYF